MKKCKRCDQIDEIYEGLCLDCFIETLIDDKPKANETEESDR